MDRERCLHLLQSCLFQSTSKGKFFNLHDHRTSRDKNKKNKKERETTEVLRGWLQGISEKPRTTMRQQRAWTRRTSMRLSGFRATAALRCKRTRRTRKAELEPSVDLARLDIEMRAKGCGGTVSKASSMTRTTKTQNARSPAGISIVNWSR